MSPDVVFFLLLFLLTLSCSLISQLWEQKKFNKKLLDALSNLKNDEGNKLIPTQAMFNDLNGQGMYFIIQWLTPLTMLGALAYRLAQ